MGDKNVTVTSHSADALKALETQAKAALTACGMAAETYAKTNCREKDIVDTGFLRNSITYAVSGEGANTSSYKADRGGRTGSYSGSAPAATKTKMAVYIGSNVEYAMYNEVGTCKMAARPFLKPAIAEHKDKYKQIIKNALSGGV